MKSLYAIILSVIIFVCFYANAAPVAQDSIHIEYYPNGNKKMEINLKESYLIRYDEEGKVIEEKKDINRSTDPTKQKDTVISQDGLIKSYYPNGSLAAEGTIQDGITKTYYEDGKLQGDGNKKNVWREYYKNGKVRLEQDYIKKIKKRYYENGNLQQEENLEEGYIKKYDEIGKLIETNENFKKIKENKLIIDEDLLNKTGEINTYYPNGKIAAEGNRSEGLKVTYYDDGSKKGEGDQKGIWREFFRNGKLKSERDNAKKTYKEYFENGGVKVDIDTSGTLKEYYENGNLKAEINPRDKKSKRYDEKGIEVKLSAPQN